VRENQHQNGHQNGAGKLGDCQSRIASQVGKNAKNGFHIGFGAGRFLEVES